MQRPPFALALGALLFIAVPTVHAQRPPDTVFLEELTWNEVRDLQRAGTTTIIIGTAGQEHPPITTVQRVGFRLDCAVAFAPGAGRPVAGRSGA